MSNIQYIGYTSIDWKQQEQNHTQGILQLLWEEGFATADQIKQIVFQHLTEKSLFHKRKLLKLEKAGLIKRKPVLFSKSGVYYLTQTGWDNINNPDAHKIIPTHKDKITVANGPHRLACINARIQIEKIISADKYYSERTIRLYPEQLPRKPDMLMIINNPAESAADALMNNPPNNVADALTGKIAIEVELTYRNTNKTKQIIGYWVYAIQKRKIDYCIILTDTQAKTQRLHNLITQQKNQFIPIQIKKTIFGKKDYISEKVLAEPNQLSKIITATIGQINSIKNTFK